MTVLLADPPAGSARVPALFDARGGESALDALVSRAWERLAARGEAPCPVCGGRLEAVYGVEHLLARWEALEEADREAFGFDPRVVDWPTYVRDVHLPSIVAQARLLLEVKDQADSGIKAFLADWEKTGQSIS